MVGWSPHYHTNNLQRQPPQQILSEDSQHNLLLDAHTV